MVFDIMEIFEGIKSLLWKAIEFPFLVWNQVHPAIRWGTFLFFGLICSIMFYKAYKRRNDYRHFYCE